MTEAATERTHDLGFDLPPDLVAQHPLPERDACRLLCVRRGAAFAFAERAFRDLVSLLRPGDLVVRNVSRVIPARLRGALEGRGTACEFLLVEPDANGAWWALVRPGRRLGAGARVRLRGDTVVEVRAVDAAGRRLVVAAAGEDLERIAGEHGDMPLPPYVRRPASAADRDDYQTVYARVDGSVAAPTAGLHFTTAMLDRMAAAEISIADLVLHVGPGTFQPIRGGDPSAHRMHAERFEVPAATLAALVAARARGARVVAVGTTVVRALESVARWQAGDAAVVATERDGGVHGSTRVFLHPPQAITTVDALVTNFHLPHSTLLLLVDAFAGRALVRAAYQHAIAERFRFFSYGDAMWIE